MSHQWQEFKDSIRRLGYQHPSQAHVWQVCGVNCGYVTISGQKDAMKIYGMLHLLWDAKFSTSDTNNTQEEIRVNGLDNRKVCLSLCAALRNASGKQNLRSIFEPMDSMNTGDGCYVICPPSPRSVLRLKPFRSRSLSNLLQAITTSLAP